MRRFLPPILLILWVFAWHGRAMTGYFYGDDWFQITPRSTATIAKTFYGDWNMGSRTEGGFYRPMVRVSFALDRLVWGDSPVGYHLTGLLLLAANALLLWALGRRILGEHSLAFAAAMAFALLPTQAEVAWWVSARADLLAGIGVLGALAVWAGCYARNPPANAGSHPTLSRAAWFGAWGLLILGLMSKETAIAGLALIPLLDGLLRFQGTIGDWGAAGGGGVGGAGSGDDDEDEPYSVVDPDRVIRLSPTPLPQDSIHHNGTTDTTEGRGAPAFTHGVWRSWALGSLLPAVALGVAYLGWRTWSLGGIGGYLAASTEPMTLGRIGETFRQILSGLFWPAGDAAGVYGAHWKAWAILFGGALVATRCRRDLLFAVCGALACIAPMAGLGLSPLAGGRYMLLPGAFGVLAWAALVPPGWRRTPIPVRWIPAAILVFFSLLWSPVLVRAGRQWSDATGPSRRSMEETWRIVESFPGDAPGMIGVIPGPIPGGYHVWAAGYAMPVALHSWALSHGWAAEWGPIDDPYPSPVVMTRSDGKTIRAWFGVPPDLVKGALVIRIDGEGQVHRFEVQEARRTVWGADELAGWVPSGPGGIEAGGAAGTEAYGNAKVETDAGTSAPSVARFAVEGPGFWLAQPGAEPIGDAAAESTGGESAGSAPSRWLLAAVTGSWNRTGVALLETGGDAGLEAMGASVNRSAPALPIAPGGPVAIPVPPYEIYRTAYAQGEWGVWKGPWRLCPLDRAGRVEIERVELIEYTLRPLGTETPNPD